ncbi:hydroxyethylthiazole kinase [Epidermidibacterium keratini]|uniref:Hydroxyethylthiazole kinase n=1 Tax=Epidermidibacterium keratini TaxID=1891644 RepID=A0A7L4YLK6_9ACTN|nr:hydroxyethylthiazole kinase [Epidermidibacterium keratini]QHB99436.1 hydroxyethylthiazole kinase [Epidermidibacterium keratini]
MDASATTTLTAADLAGALERYRTDMPLVQCLTNTVVQNFTANVLLASGASPAMVDNPREAGEFARIAGGVLVNLGTPQESTVAAMRHAVEAAGAAGTPWVLDPVAVGGLSWRTEIAAELPGIAAPTVVRGNASEVAAVAGGSGGGRGTESVDTPDDVAEAAQELARRFSGAVAVSGEVDLITDGDRTVRLAHGTPLLQKVTGAGCALGALVAGFAAVSDDPLVAASTATALFTLAAEDAAAASSGSGSFAVGLVDALGALSPEALADRVRIS